MKKGLMYYYDVIEEKLLVYTFLLTVALVFTSIALRVVLNTSLPWAEELARYVFIWQCWVGVSFAERFGVHIRIEVLLNRLKPKGKKTLELMVIVITLCMVVFLVVYGVKLLFFVAALKTVSTAMHIPMFILYTAMPLSCFFYGLRLILRFRDIVSGKEEFV